MNEPSTATIAPDQSLAELATAWAGASRVFLRHGLDFCCQGRQTVADACRRKGLSTEQVMDELRAELRPRDGGDRVGELATAALITHILDRFHAGHRAELPRLLHMAERVEHVHGAKPECPRGLAAHLRHIAHELESHMQKEEQVLFPMILGGNLGFVHGPIEVMRHEHDEHGRNLARLRELAHGFVPPPMACGTWRALYLGLAELESEVMQHIHLENHVLFSRLEN
ncbi:MAG: iron-sulfur cluster repair protein YtfE [Planctomycetes bacterium]|nr:iron-sulfur cluster repair protein YtfE [Planctomycetota bacterium]